MPSTVNAAEIAGYATRAMPDKCRQDAQELGAKTECNRSASACKRELCATVSLVVGDMGNGEAKAAPAATSSRTVGRAAEADVELGGDAAVALKALFRKLAGSQQLLPLVELRVHLGKEASRALLSAWESEVAAASTSRPTSVDYAAFAAGAARWCGSACSRADRLRMLAEGFADSSGKLCQKDIEVLVDACWRMSSSALADTPSSVASSLGSSFASDHTEGCSMSDAATWLGDHSPGLADIAASYLKRRLLDTAHHDVGKPAEHGTSLNLQPQHGSALLTPEVFWLLDQAGVRGSTSWHVPEPLYAASVHGSGLNRLTAQVVGYAGPVLLLLAVRRPDEARTTAVIAAYLPDGLKQQDTFFGSSYSCLFSVSPEFRVIRTSRKGSTYVYCHLSAGGGYRANTLPEGLGFGGDLASGLRLWLDRDSTAVTLQHHAHDTTYNPGRLLPEQGYTALEVPVIDVQVYGLGGNGAAEALAAHQQRQNLFIEQSRQVDRKKLYGDWADSAEKQMLKMLSTDIRQQ
eukprot:jgi/Chlat1/9137/Chrsp97S08430